MIFFAATLLAVSMAHPPIHIDSCAFVRSGSFEHSVRVQFRNMSERTVTGISIQVRNGPHAVTVHAHGTFQPKVTVTRTLLTPTWELYHSPAQACTVTSVQFEDGSNWIVEH